MRVLKFGGSSVGNRFDLVLRVILEEAAKSRISVVVSAMGDSTDWLLEATELAAEGDVAAAMKKIEKVIALAEKNCTENEQGRADPAYLKELVAPVEGLLQDIKENGRTLDRVDGVISFGERVSASVVAAVLSASGTPALFVDARDLLITNDMFGGAKVEWDETRANFRAAAESTWKGVIPIVTGFLGKTVDGRTTTLGRNGSDYTATLIGAALKAEMVIINTDVFGVMTADPRLVEEATLVRNLTFMEALELAVYGSGIFHPRTMLPLIQQDVPMLIRNTAAPNSGGTLISSKSPQDDMSDDEWIPTCVASLEALALLELCVRVSNEGVHVTERAHAALRRGHIQIWMSTQSAHGVSLSVLIYKSEMKRAQKLLDEEFAHENERGDIELTMEAPVTMLSVVASYMPPRTYAQLLSALNGAGVQFKHIARGQSMRSVTVVVPGSDTKKAVRTAHDTFNVSFQVCALFVIGSGTVPKAVAANIFSPAISRERHQVALRLVGIAKSAPSFQEDVFFKRQGLSLDHVDQAFDGSVSGDVPFQTVLKELELLPLAVVVDCSGVQNDALYGECRRRGIHVVLSNAGSLCNINSGKPTRQSSLNAVTPRLSSPRMSLRNRGVLCFDSAVGASMPVVDTIRLLQRSGDHVAQVECSLSGTLTYICDLVTQGVPLSAAVRRAVDDSFTEDDPWDDLSCLDFQRKLVALARALGSSLSMSNIEVCVPAFPKECGPGMPVDTLVAALKGADDDFAAKCSAEKDKRLRYVATLTLPDENTANGKAPGYASAKLEAKLVDVNHPAYRLARTEVYAALTTVRRRTRRLVVQGEGAGLVASAWGVIDDVMKLVMALRNSPAPWADEHSPCGTWS